MQRVPVTESQGRVHTSTATVLVMPEIEEVEYNIDPKDLRIDIYHASGAGGQNVNKGRNSRSYRPLANQYQGRDARRTDPTEEPRKKP